jgi:hypothetical protein
MQLSKAELEQILAEVTKEYEEVVKSESVAKTMGMGAAPASPSAKPKTSPGQKQAKANSPGPGNPNAKLTLANAFKAEESLEESSEAPKAEDSMPEGSKVEKSAPVEKAEGDDAPPQEEEEAPADDSAPPSDAPADSAPAEDAPPAQDAPVEDPGMVSDDDSMGPDQLLELYSGLTPEHLAMHWMAASQALFQSMSGEQESAVAQDMGSEMAPPDAAPAGEPPMAKSEDIKNSDEFKSLQKNFEDLKSQNALLEKNLEEMADKLVKKLGMPVLNSVTPDNTISKSEVPAQEKVLSKSEIVDLLKNKAKDAKLSEADKQKVVRYTMNPVLTPELKEFLGVK